MAISEDLPDPEGPRMARPSPAAMSIFTPFRISVAASCAPSVSVMLRARIMLSMPPLCIAMKGRWSLIWRRACYATLIAGVHLLSTGCSPERQATAPAAENIMTSTATAPERQQDGKLVLAFGDSLYA